ncbi:hypothetical protein BRADI_1g62980v3 [Brachypodium distachyon]|uniref:RING-type E3 ubiquitin transferase n=2 Tax=Brachypodium distachyon TaxID=15368 RepID=I1H5N9_BRADI|nr:hypothetical protein BRADI_1g62980v3 [Brachypodium distachyon]
MSSSSEMDPLAPSSEVKFRAYAVLVAFGVAAVLAVCFWRLYRLTVSARPHDMMPVSGAAGNNKPGAPRRGDISALLPVFVHGAEAGAVECAVCLAEMADGEKGRLLPSCGHRFHVECIDRWFRANSTCPLCRVAAFGEPNAVEAHKDGPVRVAAPAVVVLQG